jgi:hypothetical protein
VGNKTGRGAVRKTIDFSMFVLTILFTFDVFSPACKLVFPLNIADAGFGFNSFIT